MKTTSRFLWLFSPLLILPLVCARTQNIVLMTKPDLLLSTKDHVFHLEFLPGTAFYHGRFNLYHENAIQLEDWMLDAETWDPQPVNRAVVPERDPAGEQPVSLENWMLVPPVTADRLLEEYLREDKEQEMELEDWMLSREYWNQSESSGN